MDGNTNKRFVVFASAFLCLTLFLGGCISSSQGGYKAKSLSLPSFPKTKQNDSKAKNKKDAGTPGTVSEWMMLPRNDF